MTRNELLLSLRPEIEIPNTEEMDETAQFTNRILRPILKFQNESILVLFQTEVKALGINFDELSRFKKQEVIREMMKKNHHFRDVILGMVMGMLTEEELTWLLGNRREISRRLSEMVIERIKSQTEEKKA